ncbi:MAG: hypothetical protein MPK62_10245, partial [Alphaproteobacteria bacterium]|nr:hypothetical protein [Alphaproteobacteria bacterium]
AWKKSRHDFLGMSVRVFRPGMRRRSAQSIVLPPAARYCARGFYASARDLSRFSPSVLPGCAGC